VIEFRAETVCLQTMNNYIWELDCASGNGVWNTTSFAAGSYASVLVSVDQSTLYIATAEAKILAITKLSKSLLWSFTAGSMFQATPVLSPVGVLYATNWDNKVYAINATTGSMMWQTATSGAIMTSPVLDSVGTLWSTDGGSVIALDASSGTVKWSAALSDIATVHSSPALGPDGVLYIGTDSGQVVSVWDGSTHTPFSCAVVTPSTYKLPKSVLNEVLSWAQFGRGVVHNAVTPFFGPRVIGDVSVRWTASLMTNTSNVYGTPVLGLGNRVYFTADDGFIYCVSRVTGVMIWHFSMAATAYGSPAVGPDGTVYVAPYDTKVYALNGTTGETNWVGNLGGSPFGSVTLSEDGLLYVGASDGGVYAFSAQTGALVWSWIEGSEFSSIACSVTVNAAAKALYVGVRRTCVC
jgi:eukaryotic-like serine/threonine-protein kinase